MIIAALKTQIQTAPVENYNGLVLTLLDVIEFYN